MSMDIYVSLWRLGFMHLIFARSDIPNNNLLICDLGSITMCGAYLDSWLNFNLYSKNDIEPCFKFINSCDLGFVNSIGKNVSWRTQVPKSQELHHTNYIFLLSELDMSNLVKLVGWELNTISSSHFHYSMCFLNLLNEFLWVLTNLQPLKLKRIHPK